MEDSTYPHNSSKEDLKENINMRVKKSLKTKIKEQMDIDSKSSDELFSDMYLAYLIKNSEENNTADYSKDINELSSVTNRITTIFKNMIEKSYMQNSITQEHFDNDMNSAKEKITEEYEAKIHIFENEYIKVKSEYEKISEHAKSLIKDTKKLRETSISLENTNKKNEDLIGSYKEQLQSLKLINESLQFKANNSIDRNLLERAEIEKEKLLIEKDKHYQDIITSMQDKYNELQDKYTNVIDSTISRKKKENTKIK